MSLLHGEGVSSILTRATITNALIAQLIVHSPCKGKVASLNLAKSSMKFYCDKFRHLVCEPYSKEMLHKMAAELNIKRCWFHKDHYDIPKTRIDEIMNKCIVVNPRDILSIIKGKPVRP